MNRKTKFASLMFAFSTCALGPIISSALALQAAQPYGAQPLDQAQVSQPAQIAATPSAYSWRAESRRQSAAPAAMLVPVVSPSEAMQHLNAPPLRFPGASSEAPSTRPPVVSPTQASAQPFAQTAQVNAMLTPAASDPVDGMPGQFSNAYPVDNQPTANASYQQTARRGSALLSPQTFQGPGEAAIGSGAIGSGLANSSTTTVDSNVQMAAAHSPQQRQPVSSYSNAGYLPPVVSAATATGSPAPAYIRRTRDNFSQDTIVPDSFPAGPIGRATGGSTIDMNSIPSVINQDLAGGTILDAPVSNRIPSNSLVPMDLGPAQGDFGQPVFSDGGFAQPYFQQPVVDGSCVDPGCVGGYGYGQGQGPGHFDQSSIASRFAASGSVAGASRYFSAEYLYWNRSDAGGFGATNAGALGDLDADSGGRFTLGRRFDYTAGDEFTYFGTLPMESRRETVLNSPNLNALFTPGGFFGFNELGSFFNAFRQVEFRSSEIHSFEYNRVRWNWDVFKTFIGMRVINVNDDYSLFSDNGATQGTLRFNTNNFLIGPHIGGEYFYDVGYRASWSAFGKLGAYVNLNELDTDLVNNNQSFINRDSSSVDISCSLELGVLAHYQLSSRARFRAGYTLLWLNNLAGATDNFPNTIGPGTGDIRTEEEMFFHGISFGIELYR